MTFWQTSTDEQKLEQIRSAIDLGLTCKQTAMNLGTSRSTVWIFAKEYGLHFSPLMSEGARARIAVSSTLRALNRLGYAASDASNVHLFPREGSRTNLFEPHPNDEGAFA